MRQESMQSHEVQTPRKDVRFQTSSAFAELDETLLEVGCLWVVKASQTNGLHPHLEYAIHRNRWVGQTTAAKTLHGLPTLLVSLLVRSHQFQHESRSNRLSIGLA